MKTIIHFVLFLCFNSLILGQNRFYRKELDKELNRAKNKRPKICLTSNIDVQLEKSKPFEGNEDKGLVHVSLPLFKSPLRLCFPKNLEEYAQVFLLSHATCRQMGFVTFASIQEKKIHTDSYRGEDINLTTTTQPLLAGLKATSWICKGHEQAISLCEWNNIQTEECNLITELTCGNCQRTMTDLEGTINIPGYSITFLYDLTCEWQIEVPEHHSIFLEFNQLNARPLEQSVFQCSSGQLYIELVYGEQGKFSIYRYCNFRDQKNLSIPFNFLKIRYFSGLYNPRDFHTQLKMEGLSISYKAIRWNPTRSLLGIFTIAMITVVVISVSGATCFYCRKRNKSLLKVVDTHQVGQPNPPATQYLDRAFEFQRCQIPVTRTLQTGLRLRSTEGCRTKYRTPSVFRPISAASDALVEAFRQISSQSVTPRTIIPEVLKKGECTKDEKFVVISKCKTNLVDRFSHSSDSSVFLPIETGPSFHIYHSESSDSCPQLSKQNIKVPTETAV